jgi:hypothetical protein
VNTATVAPISQRILSPPDRAHSTRLSAYRAVTGA